MSWAFWIKTHTDEALRDFRYAEYIRIYELLCPEGGQKRVTVMKRYALYFEMRRHGYTFEEIANVTGQDHSTVLYGVAQIKNFISINPNDFLLLEAQKELERIKKSM
jgi:chromosomal replication initiation ATPase DnaA